MNGAKWLVILLVWSHFSVLGATILFKLRGRVLVYTNMGAAFYAF